jgi:hypothetical protein
LHPGAGSVTAPDLSPASSLESVDLTEQTVRQGSEGKSYSKVIKIYCTFKMLPVSDFLCIALFCFALLGDL